MDGEDQKIDYFGPAIIMSMVFAAFSDALWLGIIAIAIPGIGIAIAGAIILVHYLVGLTVLGGLFSKLRGLFPKLVLFLGVILPLPTTTLGLILGIAMQNKLVEFLVTQAVLTAVAPGAGNVAGAAARGALAAGEKAAVEIAEQGAARVAETGAARAAEGGAIRAGEAGAGRAAERGAAREAGPTGAAGKTAEEKFSEAAEEFDKTPWDRLRESMEKLPWEQSAEDAGGAVVDDDSNEVDLRNAAQTS